MVALPRSPLIVVALPRSPLVVVALPRSPLIVVALPRSPLVLLPFSIPTFIRQQSPCGRPASLAPCCGRPASLTPCCGRSASLAPCCGHPASLALFSCPFPYPLSFASRAPAVALGAGPDNNSPTLHSPHSQKLAFSNPHLVHFV